MRTTLFNRLCISRVIGNHKKWTRTRIMEAFLIQICIWSNITNQGTLTCGFLWKSDPLTWRVNSSNWDIRVNDRLFQSVVIEITRNLPHYFMKKVLEIAEIVMRSTVGASITKCRKLLSDILVISCYTSDSLLTELPNDISHEVLTRSRDFYQGEILLRWR